MKEKFMKFMQGRYGVDRLAKFTMGVALAAIVLALFFRNSRAASVLDTVGLAAIIYTYFRIFSRNIQKRYAENQKYQALTSKLRGKVNKEKSIMAQRKDYRIYTCPKCGQKIRVPKGKGKIEIACPKCQEKFVKRS